MQDILEVAFHAHLVVLIVMQKENVSLALRDIILIKMENVKNVTYIVKIADLMDVDNVAQVILVILMEDAQVAVIIARNVSHTQIVIFVIQDIT